MTTIDTNRNSNQATVRMVPLSRWGKNMLVPHRPQTKIIDDIALVKPKPKAQRKKRLSMASIDRMLSQTEDSALQRAEASSMRLIGRKHI